METSTKYLGITLGPIYDTMLLTSTPAGLWASSYLFSYIAKRICEMLIESGIKLEEFLVPYFELTAEKKISLPSFELVDGNAALNTGVGFFHDRIMFSGGDIQKTQEVIGKVISELAEKFCYDLTSGNKEFDKYQEYFRQYLQIYAVELEANKPPIRQLSKCLDAIELQKNFVSIEDNNYILELFNNAGVKNDEFTKRKNERIKTSFLVRDLSEWQLFDANKTIKDIVSIARAGHKSPTMKKYSYYAIVYSDGDGMGQVLFDLEDADSIREYSKKCLHYLALASDRISKFGGVTIYGGGDDLLFIVPLEGTNGTTLLDLLIGLEESFQTLFPKNTVSFGVSIQYAKYPLYEALERAYELLREAKTGKDSLALHLQKHSGQSTGFIIENFSGTDISEDISGMIKNCSDNDFLKSAMYHLQNQKELFTIGLENKCIHNVFANVFDNPEQKKWTNYLLQVEALMVKNHDYTDNKAKIDYTLAIMRLVSFYAEKGGEQDEDID